MINNLDELTAMIGNAHWFCRLGNFSSAGGFVAITDHQAWAGHSALCVADEFGLTPPEVAQNDQSFILQGMEWLPTTQTDADPFHGDKLINLIKTAGQAELLKKARLEVCKIALIGFGNTNNEWMKIGPTDYTEAVKQGAIFAIRMAVAEIVAEQSGVWCSCCNLYASGHWPFGKLPSGEIVVI